MKRYLSILGTLLVGTSALATEPRSKQEQPQATRRAPPCQREAPDRNQWPNGTLLWGMTRQDKDNETSSILSSIDLKGVRLGNGAVKKVRLDKGRLVAPALEPEKLVGAVLQGRSTSGQPMEVAICAAEPDDRDPEVIRYEIETWDAESATWKNPCIATLRTPTPRALAVQGVWDGSGARREVSGQFTFACENGAIAKCIDWGYKPWAKVEGRSLASLHQACTRMARADYCGDGRSHTRQDTPIDMYDSLGLLTRTAEASLAWDPAKASFEAAWGPDGASCVARSRDGQELKTLMEQCPGRFAAVAQDFGEGDRCTVSRQGARAKGEALLRNRSYGGEQASPEPSL